MSTSNSKHVPELLVVYLKLRHLDQFAKLKVKQFFKKKYFNIKQDSFILKILLKCKNK
jgi:hypothetical protein